MNNNVHDPITGVRSDFRQYYQDLFSVIYNTDRELIEYAKHFNDLKSVSNRVHFGSWNSPLVMQDDSLIRYHQYELLNLSPLQKHLEILRAESEAWLIHNKLGQCNITQWEKDAYIQRALGILPDYEEERFKEILTCRGFRPGIELQTLCQNIELFKNGLSSIEKELGQATTIPFGLLIQCGIRSMSEFEYYGQRLDLILHKIAGLPQIQELLNNKRADNSFSSQFILLASLRDRILKHLPKRIQDEKKILFTEILNEDWNTAHEVHGSELLFTVLDSIILSKFGFENNCVIVNNNLFLEVITSEKVIYWEPLTYSPISYYIPVVSFRSDFLYFFAATMVKIADVHYQLGRDLEKAIGLYEKAIYLNPDFSANYVNLAQVHIKLGGIKQAIKYLEKAIEINPRSAEYYHILGFAYCLIRKWSNAIYALKTAISLRSTYIEALNNLAYAYEQDGDLHRAEETYNQILSFKPNYFDAHFGLGNVYFNLKQYQRAVICFERALKITPHSEHAYYNLAQTYFELGELDSSIKTYKHLLRFKPNHATAWYNLGIIYRNKGMKKEAVKCIEQAVRTDPKLMK